MITSDFKLLFKPIGHSYYKCLVCGADVLHKYLHKRKHNNDKTQVVTVKPKGKPTQYYYIELK